jgi:hypothetical protein
MSACDVFVAECAARGIRAEDPKIDVTEPGAIAGGTFTPIDPKDHAPIWPRVMAAFEATRAWSVAGKRGPETLIETIRRTADNPVVRELVALDILLGTGT